MPAGSLLVDFEMCHVNYLDFDLVQYINYARLVTLCKVNPRDGCRNFNEHRDNLARVLGISSSPDIDICRGAGVNVIGDCVTADEQVPNLMRVEQLQGLFEVGR